MNKKSFLEKKSTNNYKHILRVMRITVFLFFFGIMFSHAATSHSQETELSLYLRSTTIKEACREIEKQTGLVFVFADNTEDIIEKKVNIRQNSQSISDIMNDLLFGTKLSYQILDKQIVIFNHENKSTTTEIQDIIVEKIVQQQKKTITGRVTEINGESIIGANIVEKGTSNGTITDMDGNFILQVEDNAIMHISFIGFLSQDINTIGRTIIDITLLEDTKALDELIVIGYGSIKKEAITGAVSRANLNTFKDVSSNNIMDKIKGSVAGLYISGTNRAGSVGEIMIRGENSTLKDINGNTATANTPLIVVDEAIFHGSLADISPNDIENLIVLKDASAAAVYGSRSGNGVILIETKRGDGLNNKPLFNLSFNYGISNQMKPLEVYGPDAYLQRVLDIRDANDLEADPSKIALYLTDEERKNYNSTSDHRPTFTNPYGITSQSGFNRNLSFSISNRMEKTRYYIATSIINQQGVEINDQFKYLSARINFDSDIVDWLNIGVKSFYSFRDNSGTPPPRTKSHFSPWASLYDKDGKYLYAPQTTTAFVNPFWEMATDDVKKRNNLSGIVTALIKIPWIDGLTYTSTLSKTLRWENDAQFWDEYTVKGTSVNGVGFRESINMDNLLWDNLFKYNNSFKEKHVVDFTFLFSQEKYNDERVRASGQNFYNTLLGTYRLQDAKIQRAETGGNESESIGLMVRGNYTFSNKYSITGTIRHDGYSAFSKNKKFGTFPSIGVNWNISKERFTESISSLDNLAIRMTYGTNGNQSIALYQTLAKISTDKYIYAGNNSYEVTQYISSLAADNLSWESTTGLNMGIDFGWLKNRIYGSLDVYKTETKNLLFSLDLPHISGMPTITSNVGKILNKGFELNFNTLNIDQQDFQWFSNIAFSLNRNKIVSIFGEDNDGDGKEDDLISSGYFIGKSLGVIYNYKVIGMYQQEHVNNGTIMQGWRPGEYMIEDLDNSGTITSDKDRQILGNEKENFRWSFTNTFKYKGITLMAYLYSIWGGNGWYLSKTNFPNNNYASRTDINHPIYDYWTPENTHAFFQRPDYGRTGAVSAYKPIDRSFIKLQKISLTYDIDQLFKLNYINNLTIGFNADNLFTFAPFWKGLDPETDQGITDTAIPSIRTYNFSINIKF